jgi:hypothetical protein
MTWIRTVTTRTRQDIDELDNSWLDLPATNGIDTVDEDPMDFDPTELLYQDDPNLRIFKY